MCVCAYMYERMERERKTDTERDREIQREMDGESKRPRALNRIKKIKKKIVC